MAESEGLDTSDFTSEVSFAGSVEESNWEDENEEEDCTARHRGNETYLFEPKIYGGRDAGQSCCRSW